jgi:hypothetical protein
MATREEKSSSVRCRPPAVTQLCSEKVCSAGPAFSMTEKKMRLSFLLWHVPQLLSTHMEIK